MKQTKHGLKTSKGMIEKKLHDMELELNQYKTIKPRSANKEATKESIRLLVSLIVGMGVSSLYSWFPVLGELQPDQQVVITILVSLIVRYLDKFLYQVRKNKGSQWSGLDFPFIALASLFEKSKSVKVQISDEKK